MRTGMDCACGEMGDASVGKGSAVLRVSMFLFAALLAVTAVADDGVTAVQTGAGGWTLSAGAMWRNVQADFRAAPPQGVANWRELVTQRRGGGDIGLYDGTATVTYQDGSVYAGPWIPGVASMSAQNDDQVVERPIPFAIFDPGTGYGRVTFHSSRYAYSSELDQYAFAEEADDDVIQPFVSASHPLWQRNGKGTLNVLGRYGFAEADLTSPWARTASQRIIETENAYYAEYDISMENGSGKIPAAPFATAVGIGPVVLWDIGMLPLWAQDAIAPEAYSRSFRRTAETFTAMSRSELDVQLHEVLLALNWECPVARRMWVGVTGGLTVNLVDWSMIHRTEWTDSSGNSVLSELAQGDDDEVVLGATGEASLRCDLDAEGRYFAEVHGGFAWVEDVDVDCGAASATIDLSTWTAGGSVGIKL